MKVKESFYSNGNIFMKETFDSINNIEEIKYFSKNGDLIAEIKNNRMNNEICIYDLYSKNFLIYKNGAFYSENKIHTSKIKFYNYDQIIENEFDDLGRVHGHRKIFDIDGDLCEDSFWEHGNPIGISKTYYKNGNLRSEGYQKYYNYEGKFKWYYESGELHMEENYKGGVRHGERIIYSKNGEVIEKSNYKNGKLKKGILEKIIKKLK